MDLSPLERAVLDRFGAEYAGEVLGLADQLRSARVTARENTGSGFFTHLALGRQRTKPVDSPSPLDGLGVHVEGMSGQLEFLLFFQDGFANLLEAYSIEGSSTAEIDFPTAPFGEITLIWPKKT